MSPNAWRTVVDIVLNGTYLCSREFARRLHPRRPGRRDRERRRLLRLDRGPGFAHSAAAKAGVKNMVETLAVEWAPLRHPGQRPGARPHAPRGRGGGHRRGAGQVRGPGRPGARRPGRLPPRAGLGRHLPLLALRHLHQRPLAGRRRGQLATPPHRAAPLHPDPRPTRPPPLRRAAPPKGPRHERAERGRPNWSGSRSTVPSPSSPTTDPRSTTP